jgi:hypothetical protein
MLARAAAQFLAVSIVGAALGCATLSGRDSTSAPCAEALGDPAQLQRLTDAALADKNWELAYRYVALIHILHPDSVQNRELFPIAAHLYRKNWAPHRTELDSIWTTSEPLFLFGWLAGFYQDGQEFPQEQMDALFLYMNAGLFRDFLGYAKDRPLISQWVISIEKNNGIVEKITGVRSNPPAS